MGSNLPWERWIEGVASSTAWKSIGFFKEIEVNGYIILI
jgi:hypothetical protein